MFGDSRLPERFWAKVIPEPNTGCWLWTASLTSAGYGGYGASGKTHLAHRVAYEGLIGPIPDGLQLDHVRARGCSGPSCCNPEHLEAVTPRENWLRGRPGPVLENARRTHCINGHEFTPENTYVRTAKRPGRDCRACMAVHQANYKRRRAAL